MERVPNPMLEEQEEAMAALAQPLAPVLAWLGIGLG